MKFLKGKKFFFLGYIELSFFSFLFSFLKHIQFDVIFYWLLAFISRFRLTATAGKQNLLLPYIGTGHCDICAEIFYRK